MKKLLLILSFGLVGLPLWAQDVCSALEDLIKKAPSGFSEYKGEAVDSAKSVSKLNFPGAYQCYVEEANGRYIFKAYFEESSDQTQLLSKYAEVAKELRSCLGRKYIVKEKLQDDGIGKMMVIRKKKGEGSKVMVYLEFSKAELASASYYLRLTAHHNVN